MSHKKLGIGALSQLTGVKIETIRYYERQKLLADPPRTEGGHRCYQKEHIQRLFFIRRSRQLGFPIEEIRDLLFMMECGSYTCGEIKELTSKHANTIREKITDLEKMEASLLDISSQCKGGNVPDCPIIDALFNA